MNGKAKDRHHKKCENTNETVPEIVFDYGFLGCMDDEETLAVQVVRNRKAQMLFAHVVPRQGNDVHSWCRGNEIGHRQAGV